MPIKEATYKKALDLLTAIDIGSVVISKSMLMDKDSKEAFKKQDLWYVQTIKNSIKSERLIAASLKSLIDSYFTFWNEDMSLDNEEFWNEMQLKSIQFQRKDLIQSTLQKGRFQNVHQGMTARQNWKTLKESKLLNSRLSREDIERFDQLIQLDEASRVTRLRKCLSNKRIPKAQYLQFGDCMAYMEQCGLNNTHFTKNELEELHNIWSNFSF